MILFDGGRETRSFTERLKRLEVEMTQDVKLLVKLPEGEQEMTVEEFLALPEVKSFPEWLDTHSPYEPRQLPEFKVIAPKYERLSRKNIDAMCRLNDATICEIMRHPVPRRNIEDYE